MKRIMLATTYLTVVTILVTVRLAWYPSTCLALVTQLFYGQPPSFAIQQTIESITVSNEPFRIQPGQHPADIWIVQSEKPSLNPFRIRPLNLLAHW